jgi:hypothetical protein
VMKYFISLASLSWLLYSTCLACTSSPQGNETKNKTGEMPVLPFWHN